MKATGMARRYRYEYMCVMWQCYQQATPRERSVILGEVTRVWVSSQARDSGAEPSDALSAPSAPGGSTSADV